MKELANQHGLITVTSYNSLVYFSVGSLTVPSLQPGMGPQSVNEVGSVVSQLCKSTVQQ